MKALHTIYVYSLFPIRISLLKLSLKKKNIDFYEYTGKYVQLSDNSFGLEEICKPIEEIKSTLKDKVTAYRWRIETGGIRLPTGAIIQTGLDDQNRISSLMSNIHLSGLTEIDFKAANGWYKITVEDLENIVRAIAQHLQSCFTAERLNHEAIDALQTVEELEAYDYTQHFPLPI